MKKGAYIIGAIIIFMAGALVGEIIGSHLGKKSLVLKSGQTLESKLDEISQALEELEKTAKPAQRGAIQEGKEYKFNLDNVPVLGNPDASVKIVVWSDFQCPFCERMENMLEQMVRANPDKYALYFKTKIIHSNALLQHEAALSAHSQGKFWELNDLFFKNRPEMIRLSNEGEDALKAKIYELAEQAGVNVEQLKADLESHKYKPQIDQEAQEAASNSIRSTPSVFINGYFYGYNPEEIRNKILEGGEKPGGEKAGEKKVGIEAKIAEIDKKLENLKKALTQKQKAQEGPRGPEQGKEFSFDLTKTPVLGRRDAKVKLVIFSDFQCPYCERMGKILEDIQKEHPKEVAVFYKNFIVHESALLEHKAAMAADAQGKFWQYHDLLFKNRMELYKLSGEGEEKLRARLIEFARELKLNINKFTDELDKNIYEKNLRDDISEGMRVGVSGTPSVFINGYFYGYSPDVIKAKMEEELKK